MKEKIIRNIISSGIEKIFTIGIQFISSILIIRLVTREDYGIIGIVVGYFAFLNIFNISLENIILRDHKEYDKYINTYLNNFININIIKSIFFAIIALILSFILSRIYKDHNFIYAIFSITFTTIADSISSPFVLYFSSKFDQKLVAKISILRSALGLVILVGLFIYPSLWYIAIKDLVVSIIFIILWMHIASKRIKYEFRLSLPNYIFIKKIFLSYGLWVHINGVVTNFIYRSDAFFLSFYASLHDIGNYNIGLTSANVANILPMILGYQNSVALSNARDREHAFTISNAFIRLSIYIGLITLLIFIVFGKYYLFLITGDINNYTIYNYMICIVIALIIVKTFASPLFSFINIQGDVVSLVKSVSIVMFMVTCLVYFSAAFMFQAEGVAIANILLSIIWIILLMKEIGKYRYIHNNWYDFKMDILFVKKILWDIKGRT